jgi:2',3'-cyclic-nucleotide 2'-phosphodiesterase (5'-nucleotidase family)
MRSSFVSASAVRFAWILPLSCLAGAALGGCEDKPNPAKPAASASAAKPSPSGATTTSGAVDSADGGGDVTVTLLVTADENGHLLPRTDLTPPRGGAGEMMTQWIQNELHCPGPAGANGAPTANCDDAPTLVLSTGDHSSGPAISTYFQGESTAQVMAHLGYAASALGNHELDFGPESFGKFVSTSKIRHLAANMTSKKDAGGGIDVGKHGIFTRRGVKIGVIGLASTQTAKTTMANRFDGYEFGDYEAALSVEVPAVWKEGADAVVVLAHECPEVIQPILAKHADWNVSLVAGAHCKKDVMADVGAAKVASCGRHFEQYLRAQLTIDKSKAQGSRVTHIAATRVSVQGMQPDAETKKITDSWNKRLDTTLSEEIGYTAKGFPKDSPELAKVILASIRKQLKTDVALANKSGIRGAIGSGAVTRASIYGAIPYENAVLIVKMPGAALTKQLEKPQAAFDGFSGNAKDGFKDATGKAVDPAKSYTVATLDYLYFGGDGFDLGTADPNPQETGMVWQTPVIDFMRAHKTTQAAPLEGIIGK